MNLVGNGWVNVNDAPSLNLSTGMTLEVWVYPTGSLSDCENVIMKESAVGASYYLTATTQWGAPVSGINVGGEQMVRGTANLIPLTWSHLATTYDGVYHRLYVNGVLVAAHAQTGGVAVAPGPLRIGGDSIWGEYFHGLIDEVRIYNRALSNVEVQSDMNTPIAQ